MFGLGPQEMMIIVVLGVLLFGKRLPEVGRSLGKSIMEFKNGLRGVEEEFHSTMRNVDSMTDVPARPPQRMTPTAPKFEEPDLPV
jgi:sec-independent protein translocase protein TatA